MSYARNLARLARTGAPTVDTAQALRDMPIYGGLYPERVETLGALTAGDGGGGTWRWDADSTADDNTGTVLLPAGHVGAGRWVRRYSGAVNSAWFGTVGDGIADDTDALSAALAASRLVDIPDGDYLVSSSLTIPPNAQITGGGRVGTNLRCAPDFAGYLLCYDGAYRGEPGGQTDQRITLRDLVLVGAPGASGVSASGAANITIERVRITGFGGPALWLSEVWDSWFNECYFMLGTGTTLDDAAVDIHYGLNDNTNNLYFNECTWEKNAGPALRFTGGLGGANNNYRICFNGCKFEDNNYANVAQAAIVVAVRALLSPRFIDCLGDPGDCTTPFFAVLTDGELRDCLFTGMRYGNAADRVPVFDIRNTKQLTIENCAFWTSNVWAESTLDAATCDHICVRNNTVNNGGQVLFDAFPGSAFAQNSPMRVVSAPDENVSFILERTYTGAAPVLHILNVDSAGTLRLVPGGVNQGLEITASGLIRVARNWDAPNLLGLGSFRLWVDASNKLRIKDGAPTSDTDGIVVGAQT